MCGIFGVTNFKKTDLEDARRALHTLRHRGPDQWSDYHSSGVYLGHRRLSILDLSENGRQPMFNYDKKIVLIVNGEIYNYKELKKSLTGKYSFRSSSDSEVLLHGYSEWGIEGLLEKIDGMYAFVIYDENKQTVYLARDRVGIKPLYYSFINGKVVFASELKAISDYLPKTDLKTDYTALYDFLTYKYIPTPKTLYKNVYKLEPAHYLQVNLTEKSIQKKDYWNLEINSCDDSLELAREKIEELIKNSVQEQLMSDVPLGFFLSGGLDSSAIVAYASSDVQQLNTFSIGFNENTHDESGFAEIVAKRFGTNHRSKKLNQDRTIELLPHLKEWFDEPFADFSCFPTYLVSEFAQKHVTVALSGDGGDEIFGGYNWYQKFERLEKFRLSSLSGLKPALRSFGKDHPLISKVMRRVENPYFLNDLEHYTRLMNGYLAEDKTEYKKKWQLPDDYDDYWFFRKFYRPELDVYTRLQYLDFHTFLPDQILTKVDRTSMQVSLECRVPLLSKNLIEYVFSLHPEVRVLNGELKGLFKKVLAKHLPDEILFRNKKGFSIPYSSWKKDVFENEKTKQDYVLRQIFNQ